MFKPLKLPVRIDKKNSKLPLKPGSSTAILPLSRCLSSPVQNGKPVQQTSASPPPTQRRERPGERSGSGLFERSNPFETDFGDKELIAQGGFGKVYKCKSNTDGHWYAVKLEQFWFKPETYFNPAEVRDVMMKEALVLAGLDHENVCRYYNTWVLGSLIPAGNKGQETDIPESPTYTPTYTLTRRTSSPAGSSSLSHRSSFTSMSEVSDEDEVGISSSNYSEAYTYDPEDDNVASFNDLGFQMEVSEEEEHDISPRLSLARSQRRAAGKASPERINEEDDRSFNKPSVERRHTRTFDLTPAPAAFITQIDVYIQMALYEGKSLRDWMDQRKSGEVDAVKNMHIFHQIVNGLKYVHKQGLVHRDIKPANMFLTREFCVKIGDFGLSKNTLQSSLHLRPSRYFFDKSNDSLDSSTYNSTDEEMEEVSEFSVGVGTPLYSSPEQIQGYQTSAAPSDVYSLGVLLCELFCVFTTQMERYVVLNDVRKGRLPPSLLEKYPQISELICAMVREDPLQRPTCADISDCGIFQHQKLHFNLQSPCSPLARALLTRTNSSSTLINLLHAISRLETEQEMILLHLKTSNSHKVRAFFPDCEANIRPAETLCESPVSPEAALQIFPIGKELGTGVLTSKTIQELVRLGTERQRLLECALHELEM